MGAGLTRLLVESVGTRMMVLISALIMGACIAIVMFDPAAGAIRRHERRCEDR